MASYCTGTECYLQEAEASTMKILPYPQAKPMSYDPFRMPPVTAVHKHSYCHQEQKHFQPCCSFQTPEQPVQPNGHFLTLLPARVESQAKELMGLRTNMGPERTAGTLLEAA